MPVIDVAAVACTSTYASGEFVAAAADRVLCVVVCPAARAAAARTADCSDGTPLGGVNDSSALTEPEPVSVMELEIPLTPDIESTAPDVESGVPSDADIADAGNGWVPFDPPPVLQAATAIAQAATTKASRIRDNAKLHRSEKAM
jgi:hypothetical protein